MSESKSTTVPLLPLRRGVLFPGTMTTLPVGRERSIALVKDLKVGDLIGVAVQRDSAVLDPVLADLHRVGTIARVHSVTRADRSTYRLTVAVLNRFEISNLLETDPYWRAEGTPVQQSKDSDEAKLLASELRDHVGELDAVQGVLADAVAADDRPGILADRVAAALDLSHDHEVEILGTLDVAERLRLVSRLLAEARAMADLKRKIGNEIRRELTKEQREAMLRQQLRAIQRELGDDAKQGGLDELRERLDGIQLPEEMRVVVDREVKRLDTMGQASPEANVIRTYLELIADLPWDERAELISDLDRVEAKLNADHYGLEDVKKRILEHLAVLKLGGNKKGTILCLAGPPGVGKTSLGQSIADATGRPFVRISLGGVRDESEIRGHRRTYVGALPGRILNGLRKAKAKNPVLLLDEVDKLGVSWAGNPEAALLEVLDPEQNHTFTDHYLEQPFDLSEVVFIATANSLERLSPPLRDRLEVIEISGYTPEEKRHIARDHLIQRQLAEHSIDDDTLTISDEAIEAMVRDYTREAGVRQLNQQITKLCRALALEVARATDGKPANFQITDAELVDHLGKPRFFSEVAERTAVPGVATGLAWTPVGGDILFIETSRMRGKGNLQITGQLGDVMQESAKAALTYVRSNAESLGVEPDFLETQDIHVHVPAGGVPKDGPSAGVTIFTALTSLLTGRRVRSDTAMTGECTLRGRVLPVGGIKEKVLAAHRAGIKRVILPSRNARHLDDVPETVRAELEVVFAEDMSDVLQAALEPPVPATGTGDGSDSDAVQVAV